MNGSVIPVMLQVPQLAWNYRIIKTETGIHLASTNILYTARIVSWSFLLKVLSKISVIRQHISTIFVIYTRNESLLFISIPRCHTVPDSVIAGSFSRTYRFWSVLALEFTCNELYIVFFCQFIYGINVSLLKIAIKRIFNCFKTFLYTTTDQGSSLGSSLRGIIVILERVLLAAKPEFVFYDSFIHSVFRLLSVRNLWHVVRWSTLSKALRKFKIYGIHVWASHYLFQHPLIIL